MPSHMHAKVAFRVHMPSRMHAKVPFRVHMPSRMHAKIHKNRHILASYLTICLSTQRVPPLISDGETHRVIKSPASPSDTGLLLCHNIAA